MCLNEECAYRGSAETTQTISIAANSRSPVKSQYEECDLGELGLHAGTHVANPRADFQNMECCSVRMGIMGWTLSYTEYSLIRPSQEHSEKT